MTTTHDQARAQVSTVLQLRPPRLDDEHAFASAHQVMADADDFTFGLGLEPGLAWAAYIKSLEDHRSGINLPPQLVPATFLVAEAGGEIVGRSSVRHVLNDFLAREGGHIGYCVLPQFRRRGYATEILRQSLVIARAAGVGRALLICDDDNAGSAAVIEACGGRLESVVRNAPGAPLTRRYWVD